VEIAKHKEQGVGRRERVLIQYGQKKERGGGDLPPLHRRTSQKTICPSYVSSLCPSFSRLFPFGLRCDSCFPEVLVEKIKKWRESTNLSLYLGG